VQVARDCGALGQLQFALNFLARSQLAAGELTDAAVLIEEERAIALAMGNPAVGYEQMMLAAWRGQESVASELIERMVQTASARGLGRMVDVASYAKSVLCNGIGRYAAAREAARVAFEHRDHVGYGLFVVAELAEAASRTGDQALVRAALEWLSERTQVTRTDWVLGIGARVRALLSEAGAAESEYRESIARLGRTRLRVELARGHLLYGEWLRRQGRRADARAQLAPPTTCSPRPACRRSPGVPAASWRPPARPPASAPPKHAARSPPKTPRSPAWPATACPTRRSPPSCSCPCERSNGTCAKYSPNSRSAPACNCSERCPTAPGPGRRHDRPPG
jgi:hypothetical protein